MITDKIYNYYALAAAICNGCLSVESAINTFSPIVRYSPASHFEPAAVQEMLLASEHMSYRQIGEMYGITEKAAHARVYRHKKGVSV